MPTPNGYVGVDPDRMRLLVTAVVDAGDTLRAQSRSLVQALVDAGLPTEAAARLGALGDEIGAEAVLLRRRLRLAEGVDEGPAAVDVPPGDQVARDVAEQARGLAEQARDDGRSLARALTATGPGPAAMATAGSGAGSVPLTPAAVLSILRYRIDDADFVTGFFDELGPQGLARLLYRVAGVSGAPMVHRPAEPLGFDRQDADRILGRTLAAYSHRRRLDDSWLGRFNAQGRSDAAETALLAPLLGVARFDDGLLDRLGRLAFGPGPAPASGSGPTVGTVTAPAATAGAAGAAGAGAGADVTAGVHRPPADVGLLAPAPRGDDGSAGRDGHAAGVAAVPPTVAAYRVALLGAIAASPGLAVRFAASHVEDILRSAAVLALPLPVDLRIPRTTDRAWSGLVAAAGGEASRRADPRASAAFVSRLARAVDAVGDLPLPLHLRAAFVPALRTYRTELYDAVTTVVAGPARPAGPVPASRAGPVAPASDAVDQIPVRAWGSLLRECLRGGAQADLLGRDAAAYGERLQAQVFETTAGWRMDSTWHPTAPDALGYLRSARAQGFFSHTLADAMELVVREHADASAEHRRRQAVVLGLLEQTATSIDPRNPAGSIARLGVGVTVEMVEARVRQVSSQAPITVPARIVTQLRDAAQVAPGWAASYEASARQLWARRARDPLRPVVTGAPPGPRRVFTGDPRGDGFITRPEQDFLGADGVPLTAEQMTAAQRAAYLAWLQSPAIVANNDRLPYLGDPGDTAVPTLPPDWDRGPN